MSVVFVFMFISGCGTKYARPDRCVCEPVNAKVEQNLEKDVYQEEDNVNEQEDFTVEDGERIAHMVIARHEQADLVVVEELDETERGAGGYGHTGVK